MTRRDFIIQTMVRMGFRTSLKGFMQFCLCVELYSDGQLATADDIYRCVAAEFGCSKGSVEKNLNRLFASSGACDALGRLFRMNIAYATNKEIIAMFSSYVALNRDRFVDCAGSCVM